MRQRLLPLVLAPSLVFALGCGPMTIWSSCFPLEYAVSSRVSLREGDRTTTQERISTCKVVDQTDSIASNISTSTLGERHAIPTADGGVLFFADLRPCRWRKSDAVPDLDARRPIQPWRGGKTPEGVETLHDGEAWWFNDPLNPTRMELWHSSALLDGVDRFSVTADLAVTEGEDTRTIMTEVPWLQARWDELAEAQARRKAEGPRPFTPNPNPQLFDGFTAEVYRLEYGATCSTPADETGVARVGSQDTCRSISECRDGQERPCMRLLGGLTPEVSADGATVRFDPRAPRPGWIGTLSRRDTLPEARPTQRFNWIPSLCVGDHCEPTGDRASPQLPVRNLDLALPADGLLVRIEGLGRDLGPSEMILGRYPGRPGT